MFHLRVWSEQVSLKEHVDDMSEGRMDADCATGEYVDPLVQERWCAPRYISLEVMIGVSSVQMLRILEQNTLLSMTWDCLLAFME